MLLRCKPHPAARTAWLTAAIMVLSVFFANRAAPQAPTPPRNNNAAPTNNTKSPSLEVQVTSEGVSVFALGVDAAELFTELGKKTGTKIVVDDLVNRKLTVNLVNRKVADVIGDIAAAYGLSAVQQPNGVFMISEGIARNPSSYLLADIDTITTKYVLAPNAKSLLPVFLQDHVKINQEQNAVILSAPKDVLTKFREDIQQFDIPAAQIMIETLMVELTNSGAKDLNAVLSLSNASDMATTDSLLGQITYRSVGQLPKEFSAKLKALVETGQAKVRANPRIATVSGQPADIFIGRQRFLSTPVEVSRGGGGDFGGGQVNFIDAGIRLRLTPYTGGEGEIIAEVRPEISVFGALDPITRLPEKSTRQAETVVRVKDGETIIIGGLTQMEERTIQTKIPILGDIPILGHFFRSSIVRTTQTELAIFITPRILSQTGHMNPEEERRLKEKFKIEDGMPQPSEVMGDAQNAQAVPSK
jgi:type II secretory pathway component GspD/PulD (secretin)